MMVLYSICGVLLTLSLAQCESMLPPALDGGSCKDMVCAPGTHCERMGETVGCVFDKPVLPVDVGACGDMHCAPGYRCDHKGETPQCVRDMKVLPPALDGGSCKDMVCAPGTHCERMGETVGCVFDKPVLALPMDGGSCKEMDCAKGTHCERMGETVGCVFDKPVLVEDDCQLLHCAAGTHCEDKDGMLGCVCDECATTKAPKKCGKKEHFTTCGTSCPLTCENHQNPPKICNRRCNIGCECNKGFVRNDKGNCVRPKKCPNRCRKNEHFNKCGTSCPLTCDNHLNPPKDCDDECNIGCECNEGFVKNAKGKCIKTKNCPPPKCGKNSHYEECGSGCHATCATLQSPPKFCPAVCRTGCVCDRGFIDDGEGNCIKPNECPNNCGKNEQFNKCGTACPLTCANWDKGPQPCVRKCVIGCECEKGFVRNDAGDCVLQSECSVGYWYYNYYYYQYYYYYY